MSRYDLIVIGGGQNGLTTAAYAAKAGRKVLVLESRNQLGGLCSADQFHPGFTSPGIMQDSTTARPWVIDELGLKEFGLKMRTEEAPVFAPSVEGKGILLWKDAERMREELDPISGADAKAYGEYRAQIKRITPFIRRVFDGFPPDVMTMSFPGLWDLGKKAVSLRMLGKADMMEILRISPMCVADWMNEWFSSDLLKAALSGPAIYSTFTGPWSPGTNANLLLAECLSQASVEGGPAKLISALHQACTKAGVEIRTACTVDEVLIKGGKVTGVRVGTESIESNQVAASVDPKTLFLKLIPAHNLTHNFEGYILNWRARGTVAKLNLALKSYPDFACRPGLKVEYARTGETLDELEKAYDHSKYREFSKNPALEIYVPTLEDPSLAPEGQHVMSVLVNYAPYNLEGGWSEEKKEELYGNAMTQLEKYMPGIKDQVLGKQLLSPVDLEAEYGTDGGHLHHGEHASDQLLVRPTPETARYATPFPGLFMCGSGSHPGGGVSCAPGALAAKAILNR
jgi:phytoene dehydrogenase-like protein